MNYYKLIEEQSLPRQAQEPLPTRISFWRDNTIVLKDTMPNEDQARAFLCKFIECCKEDYVKLKKYEKTFCEEEKYSEEEMAYISAKMFLFEEDYAIPFGDLWLTFQDMLDILSMEHDEITGSNVGLYRRAIQKLQDDFNSI